MAESLARLPRPEPVAMPLTVDQVHDLVAGWAEWLYADHRRGWRVSMGMVLPDWKWRAARLGAYVMTEPNGSP